MGTALPLQRLLALKHEVRTRAHLDPQCLRKHSRASLKHQFLERTQPVGQRLQVQVVSSSRSRQVIGSLVTNSSAGWTSRHVDNPVDGHRQRRGPWTRCHRI